MIRAILQKGCIKPLDRLPKSWSEGQELIVDSCEPSDDPKEITRWFEELRDLSAEIPRSDHERLAAALAKHDR
jgi:hypothetical protein